MHWIPSSQSSRDNRDRTGKEILKFQSKEHRYTSNYFGIDEFSGDFKDDELCPGSAFRYQRYFNSKISSTSRHLKSSKVQVDPAPTSRGGSIIDSVPIPSKRYHDSEVIVLPPGTRRQIIIKVPPSSPSPPPLPLPPLLPFPSLFLRSCGLMRLS